MIKSEILNISIKQLDFLLSRPLLIKDTINIMFKEIVNGARAVKTIPNAVLSADVRKTLSATSGVSNGHAIVAI